MRALLLDAGDGQAAISSARALHAAGWTVGLATPGLSTIARSRWVQRQHRVPFAAAGRNRARAAVEAAADDGGYNVVLPCGDDWVALLDGWSGEGWQSPYCNAGAASRCLDKLDLADAAAAVGLRTPRTVLADDEALAAWEGPAIVKAQSHWLPGDTDPRNRLEAQHVARAEQAGGFVAAAAAAGGEAVLQEPVAGELGAIVGLVHEGRFLRVAQQRADLLWPQPNGITARARTVTPDPALVARVGALAGRLGHEGLVQVEVLHPRRGGRPVVIDCNPRCYGSIALAEAAGLDLTAAWARWAVTGELPTPREARVGTRYVWTEGALRAALASRSETTSDVAAPPHAAVGVLRDLVTATHPTWDVRDPVPALLQGLRLAARVLRRALRSRS